MAGDHRPRARANAEALAAIVEILLSKEEITGARADLVHFGDDLTLRGGWLAGVAQAA